MAGVRNRCNCPDKHIEPLERLHPCLCSDASFQNDLSSSRKDLPMFLPEAPSPGNVWNRPKLANCRRNLFSLVIIVAPIPPNSKVDHEMQERKLVFYFAKLSLSTLELGGRGGATMMTRGNKIRLRYCGRGPCPLLGGGRLQM